MWFGGAALVGALVAVALGVYGNVHDAASETTIRWMFTTTLHFKAWMTTVALVLAILQLFGALWMFGKLPLAPAPSWVGPAHRITGSLALLVSLPVAYHCLWSLGFNPDPGGSRRFWHSVLGCTFYGAFAKKIVVVRSRRMPGLMLVERAYCREKSASLSHAPARIVSGPFHSLAFSGAFKRRS